ncbi:Thylakoid-associated protein [Leptolyngbya sp. BL0902]|uniref:DUF3181 family protein n=1 Tax=Leptolyngbya sp. BL0902 TaxID=1115757 RepID=UPI0018E70117|nr:DUF3181 family protein [Leptolyngbya sp. BL0902]QQE63688.1 Thylakoid-associated protein [Leptolyngbya sp. BL0902]
MSAGTSRAIEEFAAAIGDRAYIDVAKWHLYLGDAKLHTALAEALYPLIDDGSFTEVALANTLAQISVPLGGGKKTVSLADLIPAASQADLLRAIEDYQRDR